MLPKLIYFAVIFFLLNADAFAQFNSELKYDEVKDIDGNKYKTIQIGTQTWMAENLRTTKYRNGTPIANIIDDDAWAEDETGAWCYYDNDESNNKPYGKLYNWHAVENSNQICPKGWHVPTDEEWLTLINYLDGRKVAGGWMKSTGTQYWSSPNKEATNCSGWSGLPGGVRYSNGSFNFIGFKGFLWSSSEFNSANAWFRLLYHSYGVVLRSANAKTYGFSVRCIRD